MSNSPRVKRRHLAAAAAASLVLLGTAACSNSAPSGQASSNAPLSGSIRIDFGTGSQQAPMDALIKAFEAKYPGTTVKVDYLPGNSISQTILTELRTGNGPDVFYSNGGSGQSTSILPLAQAGQIASFDSSWTSTVPDAAKSLYTYNGKVYGLPMAQVPVGIVYNTAAYKDLGLSMPKNFDDLISQCKAIAKAGKSAMTVAGAVNVNTGVFGQTIAASYVYSKIPDWNAQRAAGKTTFAGTAEWKQALEAVSAMNSAGCFVPGAAGNQTNQAFSQAAQGTALMMPGPAGVINAIQQVNAQTQLALMPFPGQSEGDTRALVGYTDALAVNAKSKNIALAKAFVDFVAEPANAKTYTSAVSAISLADAASGTVPSAIGPFADYLKGNKTVPTPNLVWPKGAVYDAFASGIQGLLTGQKTPDQVLQAMDSAWG